MVSQQIRDAVRAMSTEDLHELIPLVNARQKSLRAQAGYSVVVGSRVCFTARGRYVEGTVTRVTASSIVYVGNCTDGRKWRVLANHVKACPKPG